MIDTLSIVSNGGIVLWTQSSHESSRQGMVNRLIQEVLLEDRAGEREYNIEDSKLRWVLNNEFKFFTVVVYSKFILTQYMEQFLKEVTAEFSNKYGKDILQPFGRTFDFAEEYMPLLKKLEASERSAGKKTQSKIHSIDLTPVETGTCCAEDGRDVSDCTPGAGTIPNVSEDNGGIYREGNFIFTKDGRRIAVRGKGALRAGTTGQGQLNQKKDSQTTGGKTKRLPKAPTTWGPKVSDPEVLAHDSGQTAEELQKQVEAQKNTYIKRLPSGAVAPVKVEAWEGHSRGRLANWLRPYVGARELDQKDFQSIVPHLKEKLISKNVAVKVAEHVCNSVQVSLEGKKIGTFDSLKKTVEDAMKSSLQRILQPKHEVNILRDIETCKARERAYSIVFCGVNGVGKSTSLAKITYWLRQNGKSVLIAAGDTFRHGAVEQLEVHGRCLEVPVFQMGYGADPSAVARAAIDRARTQNTDVVLIDTAGRMQDNESRMRALAKLVHDNQPDLVLFVGEALVGNNGVDQLRKFNQCLVDFAPIGTSPRGIDGIVLTKFDTIDDKVGAALSMVYELGQPIVFVGVGQTYQDLKVIEPEIVVNALMK